MAFVFEDKQPQTGRFVFEDERPRESSFAQDAGNLLAGAVSGAGQIGATLLSPIDWAARKTGLENEYIGIDRRAGIKGGLIEMGADPESGSFKAGEIGTEIAGTAGVGGLLSKGVGLISQSPRALQFAEALRTGGMTAGGAGMGKRVGGGAISGAAMAGMINPEDAAFGAGIGGAIPVVGKFAGESGTLLSEYAINPLFKPSKSAIEKLVQDAGGVEQAREAIDRAIAAGKTLSGESYTLGQAGKNAGLAATERARAAVNPENFQNIYQAQRDARIAAMQRMAGGSDDVTRAEALDALKAERGAAVEDLYSGMQDVPFMLGREGEQLMTRARPYGALTHAEKLATTQGRKFSLPVIEPERAVFSSADEAERALYGGFPETGTKTFGEMPEIPGTKSKLLSEIRNLGGLSMKDMRDIVGERATNLSGAQVGVFTKKGEEVGDMVRRLVDRGVMPRQVLDDVDGGAQALRDAIQNQLSGGADEMAMRGLRESDFISELPMARETLMTPAGKAIPVREEIIDRAVKGGDLQAVKEGIDQVISKAEGPQLRAMMQLKKDYLKFMEGKSPEYIKANNIFADKSKPITQMAVAQRMLDALTGEAVKHGGEAKQASTQFLQAYRNAPLTARSVSGMKQPVEQIFTPANLQTVRQIAREVAKHQDLQNLGRGVGSDTAQKLARANMLSELWGMVKPTKAGQALSMTGNVLSLGAMGRINNQIDALLQSPEYAGKELAELTKPQRNRLVELMSNPAPSPMRTDNAP